MSKTLDVVEGVTAYTQRAALKTFFSQFGVVDQCFVGDYNKSQPYIKFMTVKATEDAQEASDNNVLMHHGGMLKTRRRDRDTDVLDRKKRYFRDLDMPSRVVLRESDSSWRRGRRRSRSKSRSPSSSRSRSLKPRRRESRRESRSRSRHRRRV